MFHPTWTIAATRERPYNVHLYSIPGPLKPPQKLVPITQATGTEVPKSRRFVPDPNQTRTPQARFGASAACQFEPLRGGVKSGPVTTRSPPQEATALSTRIVVSRSVTDAASHPGESASGDHFSQGAVTR